MKAHKPTEQVVVYGQPMSVKRVSKPVMAEALNDAAKAIERQRAQLARKEQELAEREKQLVEATAQALVAKNEATQLAHEVTDLRGGRDRSNEFAAFQGHLAAYKKTNEDHPTVGEMVDLVIQWKRMIERFAIVDYDFVAKPLKFRGQLLNITFAQGEGTKKLSYAGSSNQPERWAFYLGLLVMNRTRWSTLRVLVEPQNGRKFVSHVACTLRSGSEPVVVTQAPRDFVLALRS
jgi:hypothetical protein